VSSTIDSEYLVMLRSDVPPSGCRHLVLATSMWLALRAAAAANIGYPADVSPQAGEGFQISALQISFPC